MLIYFLWCRNQRFSKSQIFFLVFPTLKFIFSFYFFHYSYLSKCIFHLPKNLRKSVKNEDFIGKTKISTNYLWTDFNCFSKMWDLIQWKLGSYSMESEIYSMESGILFREIKKIEQRGLIQSLIHVFLFICRALFTLSTWSYSVELMKNGILLIFFGILFNGFLA